MPTLSALGQPGGRSHGPAAPGGAASKLGPAAGGGRRGAARPAELPRAAASEGKAAKFGVVAAGDSGDLEGLGGEGWGLARPMNEVEV